jgi:hypothetical protein
MLKVSLVTPERWVWILAGETRTDNNKSEYRGFFAPLRNDNRLLGAGEQRQGKTG